VLVLVVVLGWRSRRVCRIKRDEWRKKAAEVSLGSSEKRKRTEDEWDMALDRY
jgi:hypothetical protein